MTEEIANKVYDVLCQMGGADKSMRDAFVHHHAIDPDAVNEWRFGGKLGFGGKYYSDGNFVQCYPEDANKDRKVLIKKINHALNDILIEWGKE